MILVDTSVLIDYLRDRNSEVSQRVQFVLDSGIPYGINSFIYQELLQGVRTEEEFNLLKQYLDTQRFYHLRDERESFAQAARIYFDCRRKGITLASTIGCLIAQTAIDNDLLLFHNDSDFEKMAEVVKLRFYVG